jgi:hypothetical protein
MQKKYILVEKQTTVLLGPSFWRHRFFQSELDDLEVDFALSPTDPDGYIKINDDLEIFPIVTEKAPSYDPLYETLVGPFYEYINNEAHEEYHSKELDTNSIRQNLKQIAKVERVRKQGLGTTTNIGNVTIQIATDIDTQNKYISLANAAGSNTINYKSNAGFITLTGSDLLNLANVIHDYTQTQFDWEKSICDTIDTTETIEDFKKIVIVEPFVDNLRL